VNAVTDIENYLIHLSLSNVKDEPQDDQKIQRDIDSTIAEVNRPKVLLVDGLKSRIRWVESGRTLLYKVDLLLVVMTLICRGL